MSLAAATLDSLVTLGQIVSAMMLVSWSLPRRDRFGARLSLLLAACVLLTLASVWLGFSRSPQLMGDLRPLTEFALFSAVVVLSAPAITTVFDVDAWVALSLAAAGYTLESLASGMVGTIRLLAEEGAGAGALGPVPTVLASVAVTFVVYLAGYFFVVRPLRRLEVTGVTSRPLVIGIVAVVVVLIGFDIVDKSLPGLGVPTGDVLGLRLIHGICCVFLLVFEYEMFYNRALQLELAALDRARADDARTLASSQANARAIRMRMHDIRHKLRDFEKIGFVNPDDLKDLERSLSVYDSKVETGSEALDTVLTERGLVCEGRGVTLGCIADGAAVDFMEPADVYSLFEDAIGNAMEAAEALEDPGKRVVGLVVRRVGSMASVHVENYFGSEGSGRGAVGPRGGAARGHGMNRMRSVLERYDGSFTTSVEGDLFRLDVLVPIPEKGGEAL